jgi:hypothetical protein
VPPQICSLTNPKKDAFPMMCKPADFGDALTGPKESWHRDDKTALDRSRQVVLTDPADGCSPDTKCVAGPNNTDVGCTGKIVLIKRGVCPFYQKACNMMMPHKVGHSTAIIWLNLSVPPLGSPRSATRPRPSPSTTTARRRAAPTRSSRCCAAHSRTHRSARVRSSSPCRWCRCFTRMGRGWRKWSERRSTHAHLCTSACVYCELPLPRSCHPADSVRPPCSCPPSPHLAAAAQPAEFIDAAAAFRKEANKDEVHTHNAPCSQHSAAFLL